MNALWDVLRIYGVGEQLLDGVKAFYRGANACVRVDGEFWHTSGHGAGLCDVTVAV